MLTDRPGSAYQGAESSIVNWSGEGGGGGIDGQWSGRINEHTVGESSVLQSGIPTCPFLYLREYSPPYTKAGQQEVKPPLLEASILDTLHTGETKPMWRLSRSLWSYRPSRSGAAGFRKVVGTSNWNSLG